MPNRNTNLTDLPPGVTSTQQASAYHILDSERLTPETPWPDLNIQEPEIARWRKVNPNTLPQGWAIGIRRNNKLVFRRTIGGASSQELARANYIAGLKEDSKSVYRLVNQCLDNIKANNDHIAEAQALALDEPELPIASEPEPASQPANETLGTLTRPHQNSDGSTDIETYRRNSDGTTTLTHHIGVYRATQVPTVTSGGGGRW